MSDSAESEKVSSNTDSGFRNLVTGEFLSLCSDRGTVNFELYFVWLIERPVHVHEYRYVMFTGTVVALVFSSSKRIVRIQSRKGSLPSVRVPGMPMGTPYTDLPQTERS